MKKIIFHSLLIAIIILLCAYNTKSRLFCFKPENQFKNNNVQYNIRLYNALPIYDEAVLKIIKKHVSRFNVEKLGDKGYMFPFNVLSGDVGQKKAGFLRIDNHSVEYDQISSFCASQNVASGRTYLEFVGNNKPERYADFKFINKSCFIVGIDQKFVKEHQVHVCKLNKVATAAGNKDILLEKAVSFLKTRYQQAEIDFVSKKETYTDLREELAANFTINVLKIDGIIPTAFQIVCFEPKVAEYPLESFSFFLTGGKLSQYGHNSEFVSFGIDNRCYLACFAQKVPGSGYCGKNLYVFEGKKLKLVAEDYSYAD